MKAMDYLVAVVDRRTLCPPASAKRLAPEQKKQKPEWATTVLERLKNGGYDYFCPFTKETRYRPATRQRAGFWEAVSIPVLNQYVPVRLPEGLGPRDLIGIRGVRFLLPDGDEGYLIMPESEMNKFKLEYRQSLVDQKKEEFPIKPGTTVRIMGGKMIGHEGLFKKVNLFKRRCTIAMRAMGRQVDMDIPLEHVVDFEI